MSSPTVTWSPDCVLKIVNISFKFNETVNHTGNFINILQIQLDFLTTFWVNSRQQGVRQSGKFTIFMKCLWYIAIKEFLQKEPLFEFRCKWKTEIGTKNTCKDPKNVTVFYHETRLRAIPVEDVGNSPDCDAPTKTDAVATSVSLFKFHKSRRPLPSTAAKSAEIRELES